MIRTLLVEDDLVLQKIITYYLSKENEYEVIQAKDAGEAIFEARDQFDLILLDIMLPDVDGISICSRLRQIHDCPIIFISCLDDSDTIIRALEAGGDDFLVKPFDNKVLVAKIQANLRRYMNPGNDIVNELECNDFKLDANSHSVIFKQSDKIVKLPQIEYRILSFLMQYRNQYFTCEELYQRIWNSSANGDARTVLVHIHNLRSKIEEDSTHSKYIKNEWKKGYFFADEKD